LHVGAVGEVDRGDPARDLGLDGDALAGDAAADLVEIQGDVLGDGGGGDDAGRGTGRRGGLLLLVAARGRHQEYGDRESASQEVAPFFSRSRRPRVPRMPRKITS